MLSLLFSLTVTVLAPQEPTPGDCDEVCAAVLEAALDWTFAQVEEIEMADPERLFLDVTPWRDENAAHEAQRAVVRGLVESMNLPALEHREHPAWRACAASDPLDVVSWREARNSEACRAGKGLTSVSVGRIEMVHPSAAMVWSTIRVLGGPSNDYVLGRRIRMERIEGVWQVTGVDMTIVS